MAVPAPTPRRDPNEAARIARKLEALVDIGFERSFVPPIQTESVRSDARTARLTCTRPAMGTLVTIAAVGPSEDRLAEAIGAAFEEMDRLVGLLSRRDRTTPLSHLNRSGRLDGPPPEVAAVVSHALEFHRFTRGVFDVTVAPLILLFESRADEADGALPTGAEVREALERVGARHVTVGCRGIGLERPGMALTLDGIAKGYIVDAIAAALDRRGVRRYLVDAGGDIRTRGAKEGGRPWTVAVQDPERRGAFPDAIHLRGGAVATSGSYERRYDKGAVHHHIVDPSTGRSPDHCTSVSVVAPTAMAADALATSVFLMGPQDGVAFIEGLSGCACLILDRHGRQHRSRGWSGAALSDASEERS